MKVLCDFLKNIIKLLISLTKVNIALTTQPVSYLCTNKWRQAHFTHFGLSVFVCLFVFVDKFCAWDRVNQMQQWDIFADDEWHCHHLRNTNIWWDISFFFKVQKHLTKLIFWRNRDYYRLFTALSLWISMVCQICYRTLRLLVILIEMMMRLW